MNDHIIVCPFDEELVTKLKEKAIVIKTKDFRIIPYINQEVNRFNKLHAIQLNSDEPISAIPFQDDWRNIPLAVYAYEFGSYKDFLHKLYLLRQLNIRIFLSSDVKVNYTWLRMLSSLKIACGLYFGEDPIDWDAVNDLMHYAVYLRTNHAPIEPFHYIVSNYRPTELIDFNSICFNNSARYIHINKEEQIALTNDDLSNNRYIASGLASLNTISTYIEYHDKTKACQEIMLKMNECAFCKAYRICFIKSVHDHNESEGCKEFFIDLLDAADFYQKRQKNNGYQLWQL